MILRGRSVCFACLRGFSMKVSELTDTIIAEYIHIDPNDALLDTVLESAVSEACSYTGLTEAQLDEHEDITIAVLMMAADNYDIRSAHVDKPENNSAVERILSMNSINLLQKEEVGG